MGDVRDSVCGRLEVLIEKADHDRAKVLRQRFALPLLQVEGVAHAGEEDEPMLDPVPAEFPVQFHRLLPINRGVRQTVQDEGRRTCPGNVVNRRRQLPFVWVLAAFIRK